MNYIEILNHYWETAPFQDGYKSAHSALFASLLHLINRNFWKETRIDFDRLINLSGMSKPTYLDSRKWLVQNGWITLIEGKNTYQSASFGLGIEVNILSFTRPLPELYSSSTDTSTLPVNIQVNNKNNKTIEERKKIFASALEPFKEKYGRELLNAFYRYWTQPNKSGTKFKQELEKTWELSYRLETWSSRDKQFSKKENGHEPDLNKTLSLTGIKL